MNGIFKILKIYPDGDIILSDDEFDRFVDKMNSPIFEKKIKIGSYTHKTLYTIFNGRILRQFVKATKNESGKE